MVEVVEDEYLNECIWRRFTSVIIIITGGGG